MVLSQTCLLRCLSLLLWSRLQCWISRFRVWLVSLKCTRLQECVRMLVFWNFPLLKLTVLKFCVSPVWEIVLLSLILTSLSTSEVDVVFSFWRCTNKNPRSLDGLQKVQEHKHYSFEGSVTFSINCLLSTLELGSILQLLNYQSKSLILI